jgi:hypothetical protein
VGSAPPPQANPSSRNAIWGLPVSGMHTCSATWLLSGFRNALGMLSTPFAHCSEYSEYPSPDSLWQLRPRRYDSRKIGVVTANSGQAEAQDTHPVGASRSHGLGLRRCCPTEPKSPKPHITCQQGPQDWTV